MVHPSDIHLQLEGRSLPIQIRRQAQDLSRHTGRPLTELHGWISTTDADLHRWLASTLRRIGERAIRACDAQGEFAGKWEVSWNAYGENAGVHTYTLILREAEELALEALLLEDLELHPYEYREEVVGDGLAIWAKMVGTDADLQRMREQVRKSGSFRVVRRGINDQPRQMRLRVAEWSEYLDRLKYRLVLVDNDLDEGEYPQLAEVAEENGRAAVAYYANLTERLAGLLVSKGVLSAEELSAVREVARNEPSITRHDFWRVVDVDAL